MLKTLIKVAANGKSIYIEVVDEHTGWNESEFVFPPTWFDTHILHDTYQDKLDTTFYKLYAKLKNRLGKTVTKNKLQNEVDKFTTRNLM